MWSWIKWIAKWKHSTWMPGTSSTLSSTPKCTLATISFKTTPKPMYSNMSTWIYQEMPSFFLMFSMAFCIKRIMKYGILIIYPLFMSIHSPKEIIYSKHKYLYCKELNRLYLCFKTKIYWFSMKLEIFLRIKKCIVCLLNLVNLLHWTTFVKKKLNFDNFLYFLLIYY